MFFFIVRNNFIYGRIPLILPCTHVTCEECVKFMSNLKKVECNICKSSTPFENVNELHELFPIHQFILGSLLINNIHDKRPYERNFHNFLPAGMSLNMQSYPNRKFPQAQRDRMHFVNNTKQNHMNKNKQEKRSTGRCYENNSYKSFIKT